MVNILLIGKMGTGKTTFVKQYIQGRNMIVIDVNNEYKNLTTDIRKDACRVIDMDYKNYINIVSQKRNTVCVFEDATGFIQGALSDKFRRVLVSKRHTGNVHILLFHSVLSVPPRLLQLSDYVVLFNTSDELYQVEKKYPSLVKVWKEVKNMSIKNPHAYEIINML